MAQGSVLDHFIEESVKSQIISVVPAVSKTCVGFPHYLHMLILRSAKYKHCGLCALTLHPKPFLFDLETEVKMTIKIEKL